MAAFITRHPASSLFLLASVLAILPIVLVWLGWLSPGFSQLGALSASVAAFILAAMEGRSHGVRELWRRALIWRVGIGWWGFALGSAAVISLVTILVFNLFTGGSVALGGVKPWYQIFPMAIFLTIFAGFGEEFGWRGYLVPRLQTRYSALVTSLIIGAFHTAWHTPMFLMEGQTQYGWVQEVGFIPAFLGYGVFVTATAIQMTWLFNNTRGSVLLAAVAHGAANAWIGGYFAIHDRTGMTGNYILAGLMVIISLALVIYWGPATLSRRAANGKSALYSERSVVATK